MNRDAHVAAKWCVGCGAPLVDVRCSNILCRNFDGPSAASARAGWIVLGRDKYGPVYAESASAAVALVRERVAESEPQWEGVRRCFLRRLGGRASMRQHEHDAATPSGADLIAAERQRQIDAEGWTTTHDDGAHDSGELVYAAISYAYSPFSDVRQAPDDDYRKPAGTAAPSTWPWEDEWWKPTPKDRVRELTKAGALIAAEIDRLQRAES